MYAKDVRTSGFGELQQLFVKDVKLLETGGLRFMVSSSELNNFFKIFFFDDHYNRRNLYTKQEENNKNPTNRFCGPPPQ